MTEASHDESSGTLEQTVQTDKFQRELDNKYSEVLPRIKPIKIFRTAHSLDSDIWWCVASNDTDSFTDGWHNPIESATDAATSSSPSIANWWNDARHLLERSDANVPLEWLSMLKTLVLDKETLFIGELPRQGEALSRRIAEMHELYLSLEILQTETADPRLPAAKLFESTNVNGRLQNTLERCMIHRLTHVISNSDWVRQLTASDRALQNNITLSVFEYLETMPSYVNTDLIRTMTGQWPQTDVANVQQTHTDITRLWEVLSVVCTIAEKISGHGSGPFLFCGSSQHATHLFQIISFMYPSEQIFPDESDDMDSVHFKKYQIARYQVLKDMIFGSAAENTATTRKTVA